MATEIVSGALLFNMIGPARWQTVMKSDLIWCTGCSVFILHRNVVSKEFDCKLLSAADLLEPPKNVYTHQASAKTSLAV